MTKQGLMPEGENLRKAVKWLAEQGCGFNLKILEEASIRFDLSPTDEEFLLRNFKDEGKTKSQLLPED